MQSQSIDRTQGLNSVDLAPLSLEPALNGPPKISHIFAFESGATWGTTNSDGGNDWGIPSVPSVNGGMPASFLSLSTGNAWGGLGHAASLNGEHRKSTRE
jgi:hypothetical protein